MRNLAYSERVSEHHKPFLHPWKWNWIRGEWVKPTKRIAFVITEFGLWFEVVPLDEYDEVMWQMEALWGELREGSE